MRFTLFLIRRVFMNEQKKFFTSYRIRGILALFIFTFGLSFFFFPKGGFLTHTFLGYTVGHFIFGLPHFIGSVVDGLVAAGVVLIWSRFIDEGWFTPVTRQVIIASVIVVIVAITILVIDQFYTIPTPWL